MAWTYEQKFNTLSDGDLNSQDSWSGDAGFDVQSTTVYEGAKAIIANGVNNGISRTITDISSGVVFFALRSNGITGMRTSFRLSEGASLRCLVELGDDGNINMLVETLARVNIYSSYSLDTWYLFALEFDDSSQPDKYRVRVYDGTWGDWTDWKTVWGGSYTNINTITLFNEGSSGNISYYDTITPTAPVDFPSTTTVANIPTLLTLGVG